MKIYSLKILLLSLFCLNAGCNQSPTEPNYNNEYFPLQKGNKWYYKNFGKDNNDSIVFSNPNSEYDLVTEVIGSKVVDSEYYFIIEQTFIDSIDSRKLKSYCRIYKDQLFWFDKLENGGKNSLRLYADFSLNENETFEFNSSVIYTGRILNRTNTFYGISYDCLTCEDSEFKITFKKGVGLESYYAAAWNSGQKLVKYELL